MIGLFKLIEYAIAAAKFVKNRNAVAADIMKKLYPSDISDEELRAAIKAVPFTYSISHMIVLFNGLAAAALIGMGGHYLSTHNAQWPLMNRCRAG